MTVLTEIPRSNAEWSERAATSATSHEAAGWTAGGQADRFAAVLAAIKPRPGERLLDFGCGTGALADILPDGVRYLGYDPASGMVARARHEHPDHEFQAWEPVQRFDVTAVVGAFNLLDKQAAFHHLRRLWDATGRALAASLYAGTDERCTVYTHEELERFAAGESYYWRVERHRPNDLLLVLSSQAL